MIRLYHGTNIRIEHPDCLAGRDNLDFGKGFYTTLLREHAEQWAGQVSFNRGGHPVVNVYELDKEAAESEFSYLQFPLYDEAWMDFKLCILNQALADKYLHFVESIEL